MGGGHRLPTALRARFEQYRLEGRSVCESARLAGVSHTTGDKWEHRPSFQANNRAHFAAALIRELGWERDLPHIKLAVEIIELAREAVADA